MVDVHLPADPLLPLQKVFTTPASANVGGECSCAGACSASRSREGSLADAIKLLVERLGNNAPAPSHAPQTVALIYRDAFFCGVSPQGLT